MDNIPEEIKNLPDDDLLRARDAAWIALVDFYYGNIKPRFYKHRVKGKLQFINPFKDIDEYNTVNVEAMKYNKVYWPIHMECARRGLPSIPYDVLWTWREEETPDGLRYIRNE